MIESGQHLIQPVFLKRFVSQHCTLVLFAFRSSHTTPDQLRSILNQVRSKSSWDYIYIQKADIIPIEATKVAKIAFTADMFAFMLRAYLGFYTNTIKG